MGTENNGIVFDAHTVVLRDQSGKFVGQCTMYFDGNQVIYENFIDEYGKPLIFVDGQEIEVTFPPSIE